MTHFVGFASLDAVFAFPVTTVDGSDLPTNSSVTPSYRVYGPAGFFASGSLAFLESGVVTAASNATPIVVTAAAHGLTTGMKITIASVGGNTAANGTWTITSTGANTFSLDTSVGNGAYTSGGTWKTTGIYVCSFTPTAGSGYASGGWYNVVTFATIGGNVKESVFRFGVL